VQKTSIGSGRVTVVAALARNAVGDDKADVPVGRLSSAAVDILLGLYTAQTRMLENGFRNDVAVLAVCTLLANLIDGFVAAELGKPSLSLVQKGWHGNHPIFKRPVSWTSRGKFQCHGGGDSADAHIGALIVV